MPNAKDAKGIKNTNIYVIGPVGAGKTTQFLTLPGKKFIYLFDPSGLEAIQGHDVTYEEFLPAKLNFTISPRPKGGGTIEDKQLGVERLKAQAYAQWEKHFKKSLDDGYFDQFDVIGLDSTTTLVDMMLTDVAGREGRLNYPPELNDHNIAKEQLKKIFIVFCSLKALFYSVGHTIYRQNEQSKKLLNDILIPGDLKTRGPILFGSVLLADYKMSGENKSFSMQSIKDSHNENLKTNIPMLKPFHDVTIGNLSRPEAFGLGKLLTQAYGEKPVGTTNNAGA